MRQNEILDREELIEDSLATYEEELSEQSNEELIGEDRLEELRQKQIEALTETYSEQTEDRDDEELFGEQALDALREDAIKERLEQERERLESMTDDELVENGGAAYVVVEPGVKDGGKSDEK